MRSRPGTFTFGDFCARIPEGWEALEVLLLDSSHDIDTKILQMNGRDILGRTKRAERAIEVYEHEFEEQRISPRRIARCIEEMLKEFQPIGLTDIIRATVLGVEAA